MGLFTLQGTHCTRRVKYVVCWSRSGSRGIGSSPQGSHPSAGLGGAKVGGRSLLAVAAGAAGTAAVEAWKEQPAQGMQKPPRGAGENGSWAFA